MRLVVETLAWWGLCFGLWLLTLSSVTLDDIALALAAGLLSALCAVGGRKLTGGSWRFRFAWLRWLATLPVSIAFETVGVLAAAYGGRRRESATREFLLPGGEPSAEAEGRAALASLAISAAPANYVVDRSRDNQVLYVHSAGDFAPSWARIDPATK